MFETLISALLPIVITLSLGFFAGWHHDFNPDQSSILNRMIMLYALPMSLFVGILNIPRNQILNNIPMLIWLTIGMIGGYISILVISHLIFKRDLGVATLQALSIAGPAVPFVGVSVLGSIFGNQSSLVIAICGLLMNLIQVPLSLIFLSAATNQANQSNIISSFMKHILSAIKEPVVWAPLLAFILVLFGFSLPNSFKASFTLLGSATGGVALFASGVILYAQKVSLTLPVGINILSKNILLPVIIFVLMLLTHTSTNIRNIVLITLAIPTASIPVILSVQYKIAEKETASTLFFSTILSILTMGIFIYITKA